MKVLLIGANGMGMFPLALYLDGMGFSVTAYDDAWQKETLHPLTEAGINCLQKPILPPNLDLVIYSSAISSSHPLYQAAFAQDLPLIRRGEYWASLLKDKKVVAIVGSHGKTTTTAMLVHMLKRANWPCSYLIGGLMNDSSFLPGYYHPNSPWVITEVDESDGTIDQFSPDITIAVNFDWDHSSHYSKPEDLENTLASLFKRTKHKLIFPKEDPILSKIAQTSPLSLKVSQSDLGLIPHPQGLFELKKDQITLAVEGLFNVQNANLALVAAEYLGARISGNVLDKWQGVARRQQVLHETAEWVVLSDYAHHPKELEVIMQLMRSKKAGKQVVVFQPHRYTRTKQYFKAFADVLEKADDVFILPVYAASEPFLEEGTSQKIIDAASSVHPFRYCQNESFLFSYLQQLPTKKGSLLFLGAGDIHAHAQTYVKTLCKSY